MTIVACTHRYECDLKCGHKAPHRFTSLCIEETFQICQGACTRIEKEDGKTTILVLGTYPHIKKWHPADDTFNYGYLILRDAPKQLLEAEETFHKALGTDLPSNHPKDLQQFLREIARFAVGANFNDWRQYLKQMTE